MADIEVLERLQTLVSPFGVVAAAHPVCPARGLGDVSASLAYFGQPAAHPLADSPGQPHRPEQPRPREAAHGLTFGDPGQARLIAIAEAAERYSAQDFQQP